MLKSLMNKTVEKGAGKQADDLARPERNYALDYVRSLAIFFVILIHTAAQGLSYEVGSFHWLSSVFWGCVSRAAVPLFLMCSGAVMLSPEREVTVKRLYTKYIPRLIAALLAWALFYKCVALFFSYRGGQEIRFSNFIALFKEILTFQHEPHLYYMHIILFVYVCLPVLRVFAKYAEQATLQYALVLWALTGLVWPYIRTMHPFSLIEGIPVQYGLNLTYCSIGYLFLGYYLYAYKPQKKWHMLAMYVSGAALLFAAVWLLSIKNGASAIDRLYNVNTPLIAWMAVGLFGFFTAQEASLKAAGGKWMVHISKSTLCVYAIHIFFLNLLSSHGFGVRMLPCMISIPLVSAVAFALSFAVYKLISKIPVLKTYIV